MITFIRATAYTVIAIGVTLVMMAWATDIPLMVLVRAVFGI